MANMEYLNNYEKENLRQIRLKINRKTEPELLEWIEKQDNIQGYIKRLITEDMENQPKQAELRETGWWCPRCKNHIEMFHAGEFNKFCAFCGQKVIF